MQGGTDWPIKLEDITNLEQKLIELKSKQVEIDATLSKLKKEKRELETFSLPVKKPSPEIAQHYSYIHPLVEEICLLELKEKELKEDYHKKTLSTEARSLGQKLLTASLSKEETVLKAWYKELKNAQSSQPALSTTSAETQEYSTVHNIVYNCIHDSYKLTEDLAVTVLCQAVHTRIKIQSISVCPNIHFVSADKADVTVDCDTHIPDLEETVIRLLENRSPINTMISKIAAYIASDMAPFVISIPMKKKSKKKKKELVNDDLKEQPQLCQEEKNETLGELKNVCRNNVDSDHESSSNLHSVESQSSIQTTSTQRIEESH